MNEVPPDPEWSQALNDPENRRIKRAIEHVSALDYANRIGTPTGLRGLFPSNRVRTIMRTKPKPKE